MTDPIQSTRPIVAAQRRKWLAGAALAVAFVAGGVTLPIMAAQAGDAAAGGMTRLNRQEVIHAIVVARMVKTLDAVDASPEQQARIGKILRAGFAPMVALGRQGKQDHARWHALLTAPTIDRGAVEQLRAAEIARLDQASRTAVAAIADAVEVLRPDQRAKLATLAEAPQPAP